MSRFCFYLFFLIIVSSSVKAQLSPLNCNLDDYSAQQGLTASVSDERLTLTWAGDSGSTIRLRLSLISGVPTIQEMAISPSGDEWRVLATNVTPEFRIVSGIRRVTQQQTEPLKKLGIELTEEKLNEIKWDAFWDAPLYISDEPPRSHVTSIPATEPFANHPGMPRKPEEVIRAIAHFNVSSCKIRTNGSRLEITFPGVKAGIFEGYLQFDIYKGSNLIRQMLVAKTDHPSVAFKYDGGMKGLPISNATQLVWKDLANNWQDYQLGGPPDKAHTIVINSNRLITAELKTGSITAFPPPHRFYWARESEQVLGYSWYRKDNENTFSFGMRQAEIEKDPEFYHNFALYSARPGTWQRMPVFFYISDGTGIQASKETLKFTNGDKFKPLQGYKVMGHHYHVGLVKRLKELGNFDQRLNDISTMKSVGVDIYSIVDGARGPGRHDRGELFLNDLSEYYEAARRQSDKNFLVMPNDENSTGGRPPFMGGHYDILMSRPVYWRPQRNPGEPLTFTHPKYDTVYNVGSPEDIMEMTEKEGLLISMPHPNTKRSTGYPNAIKDESHFLHKNYHSLGFRWGMGIDASEKRLGEYRFLRLWNKTNNWMAARGLKPKFALAISESRSDKGNRGKPPYDDVYGMSPVNYIKLDSIPSIDDMKAIIHSLKNGDYFITTGEILIPYWEIQGTGNNRTFVAEVEWTFPLDFIELVWGDGKITGRKIVSATDQLPFGKKRFKIPFDVSGKKWIRLAVWDVATNGALLQPYSLIE